MPFGYDPAAYQYRPRRPIDESLLQAARQGYLTRSNTLPGSPERQAVYAAVYERRVQTGLSYGLPIRAATGRSRPGEVSMRDIRAAQSRPQEAPIEVQRHFAFYNINKYAQGAVDKFYRGMPRYNPSNLWERLSQQGDPETLARMMSIQSYSELHALAQDQSPREYGGSNPFWYH